jgi:hypothetical protein
MAAVQTLQQALDAVTQLSSDQILERAAVIPLLAADRVEAGDLPGTLAWAEAHRGDAAARVSALVGAAVALLRPSKRVGTRQIVELGAPLEDLD